MISLLVVGGDGFIGRHLVAQLRQQGRGPYVTVFRQARLPDGQAEPFGAQCIQYDVGKDIPTFLDDWPDISHAFLCAHHGSVNDCATHRAATRAVNVIGTERLLDALAQRHIMPVFFSSNMVFSGKEPFYSETAEVNPTTEYGKQKAEVEVYIAERFSQYLILRLTKVYSKDFRDETMFTSWLQSWQRGEKIRAFSDMYVAPMFVGDVVKAAAQLVVGGHCGIYHLGGPVERSFFEYAQNLLAAFDFPDSLAENSSWKDAVLGEARPVHNSLSFDRAKRTIGFSPRLIQETLISNVLPIWQK